MIITFTDADFVAFHAAHWGENTVYRGYADSAAMAHLAAGPGGLVRPVNWPYVWDITPAPTPPITPPVTPPVTPPISGCECECEPLEVLITSLGPQDDDLRVRVNNTVAFDGQCASGSYSGEVSDPGNASFNPLWQTSGFRVVRMTREVMHALGCRIIPGAVISVDVFDLGGGVWQTSPWRAEVKWSNGEVSTCTGGGSASGEAADYFEIPLNPYFPYKTTGVVPARSLYGAKTFGPFDHDAVLYSHADNPLVPDDDLVINGVVLYQTNFTELEGINGGLTTQLLVLPAGTTFTVDLLNFNEGPCWVHSGALRVVTAFSAYRPNGSFTVPCPPTTGTGTSPIPNTYG